MIRLLIINAGDCYEPDLGGCLSDDAEVVEISDRESLACGSKNRITFNEESLQKAIAENLPVDSVIINPGVIIKDDLQADCNRILTKILIAFKCIYQPLMRQRRGNLWVISPVLKFSSENKDAEQMIMSILSKGVASIAKIAAIELAKKGIHVNSIARESNSVGKKVVPFALWASNQKDFYVTAQDFKF